MKTHSPRRHPITLRHLACIAAISIGALPSTTSARADLLIQSAENVPDVSQGITVPDDHEFDLPEDGQITLLQTPSGKNFELRGPFKGTVQKFTDDCNGWLAFTRAYCKSDDGDQLPVGGTRGPTQ